MKLQVSMALQILASLRDLLPKMTVLEKGSKMKCLGHFQMMMSSLGNVSLAVTTVLHTYSFLLCLDANPSKKARSEHIVELERPRSITPTITPAILTRPKRYVFKLVPPEPHISLTSLSGQKFYVRLKSEEKQLEVILFSNPMLQSLVMFLLHLPVGVNTSCFYSWQASESSHT